MIIILLGSPGSGKGTQSRVLSAKYGFTHLATGDVFRAEMSAKTPLGLKAAEYVRVGRLVPDSVVTEMLASRLDLNGGDYLLDGFPRNLEQAEALSRILSPRHLGVDLAIFLNLSRDEALRRLTSRRTCSKCGEAYNISTRPPKMAGRCDACGADLIQREDDREETAQKRMMIFDDLTQPLIAYYKAAGAFCEINAAQSPERVSEDMSSALLSLRVRS
ncbi:MAG: adenylate kinase family protein [Elusimicrobiota bacterium]